MHITVQKSPTIRSGHGSGSSHAHFTRIVELGSFSRAAERLQLPRATVSNALKRLEQRLGVRLLIRTTRQVQVTSEGSLYYQRCVQLLGALEEADTLFSHHKLQPSGKVRIDMPHSLARQIVIPALDDFYRRYPDITLALGANDTHVDLLREGVDCVLRAWETEDDSLVARRIAQLPQITCASPLICRPTARRSTSIAWRPTVRWGIFPWPATAITRWSSAAAASWNCANSPPG